MRSELNDIEKIERYLRNEMSADEKISFEKEMEQNPSLKKSVEEQRELLKGMERMRMKKNISSAKFNYKFWKGAVNIGIPVILTTALTALIINYTSKKESKPETPNSKTETKTEYSLPDLNEAGDSLWADADKYIPYQVYSIDNSKDTILIGNQGIVIAVPANCFVDENGNSINGKIDFELKEALNTETILKGGLSTYSNEELLETGGMFYINARQNGKSLNIAEGKNIYADVPSNPDKKDMLLFDGERKSDGSINWVNPKPIEKPLVPVDIYSLNFYPPLYEDSLAKMGKDVTNKKYKDSLYYSFARRFTTDNWKTKDISELNITNNNTDSVNYAVNDPFKVEGSTSTTIYSDGEGKESFESYYKRMTKNGYSYTKIQNTPDNFIGYSIILGYFRKNNEIIFEYHVNLSKKVNVIVTAFEYNDRSDVPTLFCNNIFFPESGYSNTTQTESDGFDVFFTYIKLTSSINFSGQLKFNVKNRNGAITKHSMQFSTIIRGKITGKYSPCQDDIENSFNGLNPAKVKSIWNDKFQNTLIATKEFEERMPYIHKLCSRGNNVLDIYVKNLDKKMSTIDSMVAKTLSGKDKEQFLKFAARGEGRVKTDDNCLKKLGEFYDEQTKLVTEAARKTSEDYYNKYNEKNEESEKRKSELKISDINRQNANFNKELDINLNEAYRQLGKERPRNIDRGRPIRTTVGSTGWKNVDRYVIEATLNRTTMNYTDPQTGKKAILKYEPLTIKIKDVEKYDRVLVYLLPDSLNSFMRMKKEGGVYTEKLNMLFKHELVILAYKGEKSYFKYLDVVNANENYDISLSELTEKEIDKQLADLKKMEHKEEMKKDLAYQFFLQTDAKRKKLFLEKEKFIRRIERVIFPCGNMDEATPVIASQHEVE